MIYPFPCTNFETSLTSFGSFLLFSILTCPSISHILKTFCPMFPSSCCLFFPSQILQELPVFKRSKTELKTHSHPLPLVLFLMFFHLSKCIIAFQLWKEETWKSSMTTFSQTSNIYQLQKMLSTNYILNLLISLHFFFSHSHSRTIP